MTVVLHTGHGLDWVWPFLLGYPQEKIAYIDEVCIIHPRKSLQREGKASMYDTNPTMLGWQTEEEKVQFKRFGYTPQVSTWRCINETDIDMKP